MDSFSALGLPQTLLDSIEKMGFTTPTPIQAAAIPLAMKGRDILGSAQTGTGKTGAFAIPLLAYLMNTKQTGAIVLTPTRELAAQIMKEMDKLTLDTPTLKKALLIGGESMFKQHKQLRSWPRLIVGTPGRINDHIKQGTLKLDRTDFLVLDETDKMLDMGFEQQIDVIVKCLPKKRQTLMFSATLPPYIIKLSQKYTNNPERIAVGSTTSPIAKITQEIVHLVQPEKYAALIKQLNERKGSIIVFVKTKHGADKMAKKLNAEKHSAAAIHGNLNQSQRTRVIQAFRDKHHRIMVATDVAARGLDIPHIEHVINYDLPQVPEDYIHRIGRTARAGAEGAAICFITPEDREKWRDIQLLMNPGSKPVSDGPRKAYSAEPAGGTRPPRSDNAKHPGFYAKKRRAHARDGAGGGGEKRSYGGDKRAAGGGEKRSYAGGGEKRAYAGTGEKRAYAGGGEKRAASGGGYKGAGQGKPKGDGQPRRFGGGGGKPSAGGGARKDYAGRDRGQRRAAY